MQEDPAFKIHREFEASLGHQDVLSILTYRVLENQGV